MENMSQASEPEGVFAVLQLEISCCLYIIYILRLEYLPYNQKSSTEMSIKAAWVNYAKVSKNAILNIQSLNLLFGKKKDIWST